MTTYPHPATLPFGPGSPRPVWSALFEGFDRSGAKITVENVNAASLRGFVVDKKPRDVSSREMDAIIDRLHVCRLRGVRYTVRLVRYRPLVQGVRYFEISGFAPGGDTAFLTFVDRDRTLDFDFVRRLTAPRVREDCFATYILRPTAAAKILREIGMAVVPGAIYDISQTMEYPRSRGHYFVFWVRRAGRREFVWDMNLPTGRLSLSAVNQVLGTDGAGSRSALVLSKTQIIDLMACAGVERHDWDGTYVISRASSAGRPLLW